MKYLLLIPLLFCGCGLIVAERMIDKMGDFAERMEKIQKEKREELRGKVSTIEGTILESKTIEKEVEREIHSFEEKNGKTEIVTKKHLVKEKVFTVFFTDGREKIFQTPDKPLLPGKYYKIKYNGLNEIVEIEE